MEHATYDMKISTTTVRRLRTERGWSQEHLALASGLSLRTIQRVEAEGNASRETHVCLAATFGIVLADLVADSALISNASIEMPLTKVVPTRYKVTAVLTGATLIPVLLSFAGMIPTQFAPFVSLSFMAMIVLFIYTGFGWYFTGAVKNTSQPKRAVQMLFIATALFCGFASFSSGSSTDLGFAAKIALLVMGSYLVFDTFIAKRRALK